MLVYVDDLLITGTTQKLIYELKQFLHGAFTIKDLGYAKFFLGLEVTRSHDGICVNQKNYITDLVIDTRLVQVKSVKTPLPSGLQLQEEEREILEDPSQFQRLIGRLLYLGFTRPDITYAVHHLSQFVHRPKKPHW